MNQAPNLKESPPRRPLGDLNVSNTDATDPLSPTANLRLLTKVASNFEKQNVTNLVQDTASFPCESKKIRKGFPFQCKQNQGMEVIKSRKDKSLSLLCDKFLKLYPLYILPGDHMEICIDQAANKLGTERRRIYDIINVLESLQMASKIGKNRYVWYGCQQLPVTLAKLKGLAVRLGLQEQVQLLQKHNTCQVKISDDSIDTSRRVAKCEGKLAEKVTNQHLVTLWNSNENSESLRLSTTFKEENLMENLNSASNIHSAIEPLRCDTQGCASQLDNACKEERSLGVMCQKFIMLFLISHKTDLLNLDLAAKILMSDTCTDQTNSGKKDAFIENIANNEDENNRLKNFHSRRFKTKVRRLYDIANVLTSLGLICKIQNLERNVRKPAFRYTGPDVEPFTFSDEEFHISQASRHSLLGGIVPLFSVKREMEEFHESKSSDAEEELRTPNPERKRKVQNSGELGYTRKTGCALKKSGNHRNDSLTEILHVAEVELKRLKSMEALCNRTEKKVSSAKKSLFSHHHSDSCLEVDCGHMGNNSRKESITNVKKEIKVTRRLVKLVPDTTCYMQSSSKRETITEGGLPKTSVAFTRAPPEIPSSHVPLMTQFQVSANSPCSTTEKPVIPLAMNSSDRNCMQNSNSSLVLASSNRNSIIISQKSVLKSNPVHLCMIPNDLPSTTLIVSNNNSKIITQLPTKVLSSGEMYTAVKVGSSVKLVPLCNSTFTTLTPCL